MSMSINMTLGAHHDPDHDKNLLNNAVVPNGEYPYISHGEKMGNISLAESPIVAIKAPLSASGKTRSSTRNRQSTTITPTKSKSDYLDSSTSLRRSHRIQSASKSSPHAFSTPGTSDRVTRSVSKAKALEKSTGKRRKHLAENADDLIAQIDGCLS